LGVGKRLLHLGRQTGGPRLVVSNEAVSNRELHPGSLATLDTPRHTPEFARTPAPTRSVRSPAQIGMSPERGFVLSGVVAVRTVVAGVAVAALIAAVLVIARGRVPLSASTALGTAVLLAA